MNIIAVLRDKKKLAMVVVFLVGGVFLASVAAGDLMSTICKGEVVSVGDRKGVVLTKCGPPLSKSQEAVSTHALQTTLKKKTGKKQADNNKTVTTKTKTIKERAETWTYNIDGSYRFFIFKEGKLANIETGGLAH
jgi:hypothetical protein